MKLETSKTSDCSRNVIIPVFGGERPELPCPELATAYDAAVGAALFDGSRGSIFAMPAVRDGALTFAIFAGMGKAEELSPRSVFNAMFGAFFKAIALKARDVQVLLDSPALMKEQYAFKAAEAAVLTDYSMGERKKDNAGKGLTTVTFIGDAERIGAAVREGAVCGERVNEARRMVNAPADVLTPSGLADECAAIARDTGMECSTFYRGDIERLGMNAFLAVSRGSSREPALIVLRYLGDPESESRTGLIGKGITFDSGGYNMKGDCSGMNEDMGGAAAVIAAIGSAAAMKLKLNVIAVIAACENMVSDRSYLPGEIVRSMSGRTIEVANTDCEGRLTLADAITYAVREEKVTRIVDVATLTGAVLTATGNETAGMVASSDGLAELIMRASELSGEKVWRLPLDRDLMYAFDSDVADIKNMPNNAKVGAGSSMAGMFLEPFTEGLPWAHIDMACAEWNRHIANAPKVGSSAFGSRLLYSLLRIG